MGLAGMHAGGKGIETADPVGKALFLQKLQRAVGDGGLIAEPFGRKPRQNVISPQRLMCLQQDFQHAPPNRREPDPAFRRQCFRPRQGIGAAMAVIMDRKSQIGRLATGAAIFGCGHWYTLTCYIITYISALSRKEKAVTMRYIISLLLTTTATTALAEVPRVVTDMPPVHALVAQVMGDLGAPTLLLEKGANAHSFQLRPSQAMNLQEADLVVWIGPEMTPWLDRALEGTTNAAQLRLLSSEGTFRQEFGPAKADGHDHGHDHADDTAQAEADHDHETAHDHEGHDHTGLDPHAWLDPANASHWLNLIAAELSAQDPENAAIYAANAEQGRADISTLDAEIAALLAPVKDRPLVVFHDAYGYFAGHYGLTIAASIAEGDAAGPGAKHIAAIEALLREGPVCLFPEANHDPKLVTQLADATSLRVAGALDPEGSLLEPGPALYGQLLRGLAQTIADCAD
jgi:zinc transport system substrate-binding protein